MRHRSFFRRTAIALPLVCGAIALFSLLSPCAHAQEWYKGNPHMHTIWTDGRAFPEEAVQWYKDRDYHFVVLSDHDVFQKGEFWRTIDGDVNRGLKVTERALERYIQAFGKENVETRTVDDKLQVRLKTFAELQKEFDSPGKFLMIPGEEVSARVPGRAIHMNAVNITETMPKIEGANLAETIRLNTAAVAEHAKKHGLKSYLAVNHPIWEYYDTYPQDVIDNPETRFMEIVNSEPTSPPHEKFWTKEKLWDIINSFRIEDGKPAVYGIGSDDRHYYFPGDLPLPGIDYEKMAFSWIMVRAKDLTVDTIMQAMLDGDFYSSSGVILDKLDYDPKTKTLSVKVQPEEGTNYQIRFIGTKRGFDRTTQTFDDPAKGKKPAREGLIYSDRIGEVFERIDGTEGSYTIQKDDLYVRAQIVSNKKNPLPFPNKREVDKYLTAWTQPYGWEEGK